MFKKFTLINLFTFMTLGLAISQTTDSTSFEVVGSVDAYYRATFGADFDQAPATSFANLPGFSLGMANINATYYKKNAGVVADLVFGPRGEDATFLSPFLRPGGSSSIVNQLYAFWDVSDKVTITMGNFNTFLGYEVISPTGNFNYSTSYMFSYGPFSHTGLKVDADLGGGFSLMAGVFNPTDATEYNPTNDYAAGLQLGYSFDSGSAYLNTLISDEFYQVDLTAGFDLTEDFYLGLNTTIAQDAFAGVAGYLQYALNDNFKLGTRVEYFQDNGVSVVGTDENIFDVTLTGQYKVGNLTIIPEVRMDKVSTPVYANELELEESLSSLVLAVVYGF
jgi:hypothetical protein